MKHVKIVNKSRWQTDEIMPLLNVAFASARTEFKRPCTRLQPFRLTIGRTRSRTWHCKSNCDSATICFADPGKGRIQTAIGNQPCTSMSEVIIGVAAWVFASGKGAGLVAQACTRDAVLTYRERATEVEAKINAVIQRKKDKVGAAFAQEVFDGIEQSTLDFKMAKLNEMEQIWLRKLKLATTKIKSLRRRKAALRAAETRKQRKSEAQVAAAAIPPTNPGIE